MKWNDTSQQQQQLTTHPCSSLSVPNFEDYTFAAIQPSMESHASPQKQNQQEQESI
jgi:hypothetical protein